MVRVTSFLYFAISLALKAFKESCIVMLLIKITAVEIQKTGANENCNQLGSLLRTMYALVRPANIIIMLPKATHKVNLCGCILLSLLTVIIFNGWQSYNSQPFKMVFKILKNAELSGNAWRHLLQELCTFLMADQTFLYSLFQVIIYFIFCIVFNNIYGATTKTATHHSGTYYCSLFFTADTRKSSSAQLTSYRLLKPS